MTQPQMDLLKELPAPKKRDSVRIPVFEHALPHRILLAELQAQGLSSSADALAVSEAEQAYGQLEAAKDELDDWSTTNSTLLPTDVQQTAERNAKLQKVREAEWNCKQSELKLTDGLHLASRSALCFSGGGIRSACICLGVLQGLARFSMRDPEGKPGILHNFDFLSTVSGGGYIGSWFMAWAKRHPLGYAGAVSEISTCGSTGLDPEPRPLLHLREYTSFLAPRLGGLTLDTWTLAATVMRNLFLNNCMLLPAAAALMCAPLAAGVIMTEVAHKLTGQNWIGALVLLLSTALLLLAFVQNVSMKWAWRRAAWVLMWVANAVISLSVAGLLVYWIAGELSYGTPSLDAVTLFRFTELIAIPLVVPAVRGILVIGNRARSWREAVIRRALFAAAVPVVASATSALLLLLAQAAPSLEETLNRMPHRDLWPKNAPLFVLGLPLVWAILLTAASLFTGVVAKSDLDENREWWARMKATHMLLMLAWLVASTLAFYGASLFHDIVPVLAALTGAVAAFAGKSPSTPAQEGAVAKSKLGVIAPVCELLFLFFLAITLADFNYWILEKILHADYQNLESGTRLFLYISILIGFAIFCNLFFSVNTFSLHAMYRVRLIRAYLGASNEFRTPDFFTNFDGSDNLNEEELYGSHSPLHVINATLNLVATNNTAWTQRKAESFTFSPLHCGSLRIGYVPTGMYAGTHGVTLGTAMAISGAAFNPNMGYHSSPLLTLIMTLFNVRLGYWLPNPRLDKGKSFFKHSSPRLALLPLLNEALGRTNDTANFIQVSDGGHFENLGLYEMVMRRCRRIIVVDGGADCKFQFEDLGNAVRKIRIDFGIQIEFRNENHIQTGNNPQTAYCAIADILYRDVDGPNANNGELIYLKPAVRGTEALDVQHYADTHTDFPNQTTADQFFTEEQFESYRKLGTTMVQEIMACGSQHASTIEEFFTAATQYGYVARLGLL